MHVPSINHEERIKRRLLEQFKQKQNIVALVKAVAAELQEINTEAESFLTSLDPTQASGELLDFWGLLVQENRNGRGDDTYRSAILNKIPSLRTSGTLAEVTDGVAALVGTDNLFVRDAGNATVYVDIVVDSLPSEEMMNLWKQEIQAMLGGGIGLIFTVSIGPNPFRLDTEGDRGLGTLDDPSVGGTPSYWVK